jgi:hypothetical protein
MATFQTIFNLDDTLVAALVAAFNADSYLTGNLAYGPRATGTLPKNRIDVASLGFAKASEQQVYALGRHWDSHFSGQVSLTVITPRGNTGAAPGHGTRVGRLRYLMTPYAQLLTLTNFPYYEVLSIEQTSQSATEEFDTDTDQTELIFTIHLGLLATALTSAT